MDLILELMEHQKALRRVTLGRLDRDRFFEILLKNTSGEKGLEVRLPQGSGGIFSLECSEPELAVLVNRYGRDGIRVRLEGVLEQDGEQETPQAVQAVFGGSVIYILQPESVCIAAVKHFHVRQRFSWNRSAQTEKARS